LVSGFGFGWFGCGLVVVVAGVFLLGVSSCGVFLMVVSWATGDVLSVKWCVVAGLGEDAGFITSSIFFLRCRVQAKKV
jgi:hypothetical protein